MDCPNNRHWDCDDIADVCETVCNFYCKYFGNQSYCRYCPVKDLKEKF